jgi:hypothetical protein
MASTISHNSLTDYWINRFEVYDDVNGFSKGTFLQMANNNKEHAMENLSTYFTKIDKEVSELLDRVPQSKSTEESNKTNFIIPTNQPMVGRNL